MLAAPPNQQSALSGQPKKLRKQKKWEQAHWNAPKTAER
jgi:hypothetical protein